MLFGTNEYFERLGGGEGQEVAHIKDMCLI